MSANIQNPYVELNGWQNHCHRGYNPVIVPGEVTQFYINFEPEFIPDDNFVEFNEWTIGLIDENGQVQPVPTQLLQQVFLDGGTTFHVYGYFVCPDLNNGTFFRPIIYKANNNVVKYIGNCMRMIQPDNCPDSISCTLEYRNTTNYFNFEYEQIPDWFHTIRVDIQNPKPPFNDDEPETLQEISTGTRKYKIKTTNRYYELEALDFDNAAHEAGLSVGSHDTVKMNGEFYLTRSQWTAEGPKDNTLRNGIWEVWEVEYSEVNRSCP